MMSIISLNALDSPPGEWASEGGTVEQLGRRFRPGAGVSSFLGTRPPISGTEGRLEGRRLHPSSLQPFRGAVGVESLRSVPCQRQVRLSARLHASSCPSIASLQPLVTSLISPLSHECLSSRTRGASATSSRFVTVIRPGPALCTLWCLLCYSACFAPE